MRKIIDGIVGIFIVWVFFGSIYFGICLAEFLLEKYPTVLLGIVAILFSIAAFMIGYTNQFEKKQKIAEARGELWTKK